MAVMALDLQSELLHSSQEQQHGGFVSFYFKKEETDYNDEQSQLVSKYHVGI